MSGSFSRKNRKNDCRDEVKFDWFDMTYEEEFPPLGEECDSYNSEYEDVELPAYSEVVHRGNTHHPHNQKNDDRGHSNKEDHCYESTNHRRCKNGSYTYTRYPGYQDTYYAERRYPRYQAENYDYANVRYSDKLDQNYDPTRYEMQREHNTERGYYSRKSDYHYDPERYTGNHQKDYQGDFSARDNFHERYQRQKDKLYVSGRYAQRSPDHHYRPGIYQRRYEHNEPKQDAGHDRSKEQWHRDEYVNTPGIINISSKEQWMEIMKTSNAEGQPTKEEISRKNDRVIPKEHAQRKEQKHDSMTNTASTEKLDKSAMEEWLDIIKTLKAQTKSIQQKVSKNTDIDYPFISKLKVDIASPVMSEQNTDIKSPDMFKQNTDIDPPVTSKENTDIDSPAISKQNTDIDSPVISKENTDIVSSVISKQNTDIDSLVILKQNADIIDYPIISKQHTDIDSPVLSKENANIDSSVITSKQNIDIDSPVSKQNTDIDSPVISKQNTDIDSPITSTEVSGKEPDIPSRATSKEKLTSEEMFSLLDTQVENNDKPTTSNCLEELNELVRTLTLDPDDDEMSKIQTLAESVSSSSDLKEVADLIYKRCMKDREFGKGGACLCDRLANIEVEGTKFRNVLLSLVQIDYKDKDNIREKNPGKFLGFVTFLCQVFGNMRTIKGEPFTILSGPIYDCINTIINDGNSSDDDYECLLLQVQSIGKELEAADEPKMVDLMQKIRTQIIKDGRNSRARCSLLELFESYSKGWKTLPNEITRFYCDTMAEIFTDAIC